MEFLQRQNASDENIVITVNGSDVIVGDGKKYENAVKYFIQNTAESEDKFSEEEIHKEHMQRCYLFFKCRLQKRSG